MCYSFLDQICEKLYNGGMLAEGVINILANDNIKDKKIYITGHSQGGMLAQRAGAQITLHDNLESQLEEVAYFNGPGIVFVPMTSNTRGIKSRLEQISNKVSRHVVFAVEETPYSCEFRCDLTAKLGSHIKGSNFYYYWKSNDKFPYDATLLENMLYCIKTNTSDFHSMYRFMDELNLYERD